MNRRVEHPSPRKKNVKNSRNTANRRKVANKSDHLVDSGSSLTADAPPLLSAWLGHHWFSCRDSLQQLLSTPLQSAMTWLVIAIALVLPGALYLGLSNVQQLGEQWQGVAQLSVYAKHQAKPLAIEQLHQRLLAYPEVATVQLITPEQAKEEFQEYSGLGNVLQNLSENPLPAVLQIQASDTFNTPERLGELQAKLAEEPLVDTVQLDMNWLLRLQQMMQLIQHLVLALAVLLGLGVLLIIGNTIRLAIENRRSEIVVIKMVGGTDGFVKRPFLYTGFWYGLGGGVLGLLLLMLMGLWLSEPVAQLAALYDSEYLLSWTNLHFSLFLLLLSACLGWLGAWISVSRHLKGVEPA